ncbi:NACHT domain-containing protein [Rheinheimera faecalis]|uniref:NACHT domain-containing protein n=1 Tax=Rheinheimera faecalis TaxID=2901141 RepID=UPI001E524088|nr:NACHT domain-containing protein [Rheinheimera faecalis]
MKELDASLIAIELVKEFVKPVFDGVGKISSEALDKLKVTLNTCFSKYITRSYDRYSKIKTILYRDAPVNIKDFYVRTDLNMRFGEILPESMFLGKLRINKRVVVSGTAGSGKSTFCKSVFLDLIEKPVGIFPIFVELRHLNSDSEISLFDFILKTLSEIEPNFNKSQLDYSLCLGKTLLIFDGFDELNNELRDKYEKEIVSLASKYQNILILLSSRPDDRFQSWEEFYIYNVIPLDKLKSKSLINKLDYDKQVKQKFLDELDSVLFEKHESFASNPLLLTMMLLTYEQIAEIPNKIHLFYEQAFLTLFNKHDSLKSLYKRKSLSELPLDEFKKMLSAFSVVSYVDRKYYFSEDEVTKYLKNASRISGIDIDVNLFLCDLLDTVCIMQRDGNGYTFTHRSFQEYFTSIFLVNYAPDNKFELIDRIAFINDRDNVIPMFFDINQDLIEQKWIMPRMELMLSELSAVPDTVQGKLRLLSIMYSGLTVYDDEDEPQIAFRLYSREGDYARFIHVLYKIYGEEMHSYYENVQSKGNTPAERNAMKKLIEIIRAIPGEEPELLSLVDVSRIDSQVAKVIYKSKCYEHLNANLSFLALKLNELRDKYQSKQAELSELLFG